MATTSKLANFPLETYVPKTRFLKEAIARAHFSNKNERDYITELAFLERFMINGWCSRGEAIFGGGFERTYEKEYLEMLKELDRDRYEAKLSELKQEKLKAEIAREEWRAEEENLKKWWAANGGKP